MDVVKWKAKRWCRLEGGGLWCEVMKTNDCKIMKKCQSTEDVQTMHNKATKHNSPEARKITKN